jgi:hypothetical protein
MQPDVAGPLGPRRLLPAADIHAVGASARLRVYRGLLGLPALVDVRRYKALIDIPDALHGVVGQRREVRSRDV